MIFPAALLFLLAASATTVLSGAAVTNILYSGERLSTGQYLAYGEAYGLIMQEDCNLVLYDYKRPVWATNTGGIGRNCYCAMQVDGNLVVYTPDGRSIWASNTGGARGNYILVLQKDRNLVIYGGALWATGTNNGLQGMGPIVITSSFRTDNNNNNVTVTSSESVV
ncbi:hypothetical protein H6P81_017941 [Aristolochia fimbriata]|uniref:Bulb-type lectin domain-containing protein n=1 Tax=Aristolochia fimbriata TaxID=158543 RepID=A0AAV7E007_ARIFI|nr:hypothetical protein H6P81_017941 [Aristolochia fimbriata]